MSALGLGSGIPSRTSASESSKKVARTLTPPSQRCVSSALSHREEVNNKMSTEQILTTVGASVTYVDEHGRTVPALVTAVHGYFYATDTWTEEDVEMTYPGNEDAKRLVGQPHAPMIPCINLVYVSYDSSKKDPYGRQVERASSVQHQTQTTANGRFWR